MAEAFSDPLIRGLSAASQLATARAQRSASEQAAELNRYKLYLEQQRMLAEQRAQQYQQQVNQYLASVFQSPDFVNDPESSIPTIMSLTSMLGDHKLGTELADKIQKIGTARNLQVVGSIADAYAARDLNGLAQAFARHYSARTRQPWQAVAVPTRSGIEVQLVGAGETPTRHKVLLDDAAVQGMMLSAITNAGYDPSKYASGLATYRKIPSEIGLNRAAASEKEASAAERQAAAWATYQRTPSEIAKNLSAARQDDMSAWATYQRTPSEIAMNFGSATERFANADALRALAGRHAAEINQINANAQKILKETGEIEAKILKLGSEARLNDANAILAGTNAQLNLANRGKVIAQIDEIKAGITKLEAEARAIDANRELTGANVELARATKDEIMARIDELRAKVSHLESQTRLNEANVGVVELTKGKIVVEIGEIHAKATQYKADAKRLEADAQLALARADLTGAEKERVQAEVGKLQAETRQVSAEIDRIVADTRNLTAQTELLGDQKGLVQAQTTKTAADAKKTTAEIDVVSATRDEINSRVELNKNQLDLLRAQIEDLRERMKLYAPQAALAEAQAADTRERMTLIPGARQVQEANAGKLLAEAWLAKGDADLRALQGEQAKALTRKIEAETGQIQESAERAAYDTQIRRLEFQNELMKLDANTASAIMTLADSIAESIHPKSSLPGVGPHPAREQAANVATAFSTLRALVPDNPMFRNPATLTRQFLVDMNSRDQQRVSSWRIELVNMLDENNQPVPAFAYFIIPGQPTGSATLLPPVQARMLASLLGIQQFVRPLAVPRRETVPSGKEATPSTAPTQPWSPGAFNLPFGPVGP